MARAISLHYSRSAFGAHGNRITIPSGTRGACAGPSWMSFTETGNIAASARRQSHARCSHSPAPTHVAGASITSAGAAWPRPAFDQAQARRCRWNACVTARMFFLAGEGRRVSSRKMAAPCGRLRPRRGRRRSAKARPREVVTCVPPGPNPSPLAAATRRLSQTGADANPGLPFLPSLDREGNAALQHVFPCQPHRFVTSTSLSSSPAR